MSTSLDASVRSLNDCGCCEGATATTPAEVRNRPGLNAVAYRAGTHQKFFETMEGRLTRAGFPALQRLTTRERSDLTMALLDAAATMLDVLTFYLERIANEAFLRTATERRSLIELARLIGYRLSPGVAANAFLAFTIEDAPGAFGQTLTLGTPVPGPPPAPPPVPIDIGVKVQSVPAPGEQAQMFETVEKIEARADWNLLRPRITQRHPIDRNPSQLYFAGIATGLKAGDGLILFPDDRGESVYREVAAVATEDQKNRTLVKLKALTGTPLPSPPNIPPPRPSPLADFQIRALNLSPASIGARTANVLSLNRVFTQADLRAIAIIQDLPVRTILTTLAALQPPPPAVFALRTRASLFGHNAPKWESLAVTLRFGEIAKPDAATAETFQVGAFAGRKDTWAEAAIGKYNSSFTPAIPATDIFLDNVYPQITKDSFVILKSGGVATIFQVEEATEQSISDFTLSAKASRLTLNASTGFDQLTIRGTTVLGQSEELKLARLPIEDEVSGNTIELEGWVDGLSEGRRIIVCGELVNPPGARACEVAELDSIEQDLSVDGFTRLVLLRQLTNTYVRTTVTISANIALATHGETVQEVVGSGDTSQAFQHFVLRQPPVTHVSSSSATGTQSTLEIRVNGLLWKEVADLFDAGPEDRVYTTRLSEDGVTTIQFGDGRTGARPPSGASNITARYRRGIGLGGLVEKDQLNQLLTRPLGVRGATNPIDASGAADPEVIADARRNATLGILSLGRIVSLKDYEDFARAFAGIGKALATFSWNGERRGVFVTVAGSNGAAVVEGTPLYDNLIAAMLTSGDPTVPLTVGSFRPKLFQISAEVRIDPAFLAEKVLPAVDTRLRERFSFDARAFGQAVEYGEVVAAIQGVDGVTAVNLKGLFVTDPNIIFQTPAANDRLTADAPRPGTIGAVLPAELLTLDPRPVDLKVMR